MGNYQPDAALLCASLVLSEISALESIAASNLEFLHMECARLIERYSARDDLAHSNPDLWEETQVDMMSEIAEDLEGFIDLISLCKLSFEITAPNVVQILEILDVQLQCQLMIIDEVLERLAALKKKATLTTPTITGYAADNVIVFPC